MKPSVKEALNFDASTREQINFYFNYISENKGGIPQADNDIISGFLGHLYLLFSDLVIDTKIDSYRDFLKEYKIIRYVDDTFIVINFLETTEKQQKETITDSLTSQISDVLHYHSGLRLNTKTRLYWLSNPEHREELLKDLKKVSPEYHFHDDDSDETPQNKIANIFHELQKLKSSSIDISLGHDGSLQEEILKEVYDKNVNQLLETEDNNNLIGEIFTDFDFNFVKAMPREIIVIIAKNEVVLNNFIQFLYEKKDLTTRDIYLIIKFLCQTNFTDNKLLDKLENNPLFSKVINVYREAQIASELPGYYNLPDEKVLLLLEDSQIVEQIRLRVFNERIGFYSVALNHLLNEVHAICLLFDSNKKNKYEADDAIKYLASKWVPHETCIDIRNLFDRRNRNTVSHPGSRENIAWGVTKDEYLKYFDAVNKCLKIIL